jgi:hypothetical protein
MPRTIKCPNCAAPLQVDPASPVLRCQFCGYDSKQTMAFQPATRAEPTTASPEQARRLVKIILWVTIGTTLLPGLIIAGVCAFATSKVGSSISSSQSGGGGGANESIGKQAAEALKLLAGGASDEPADPEQALAQKLEAYLKCVNYHSPRVHDARARYLGWVRTPQSGPTCKEPCIGWGIHTIFAIERCVTDVNKVKTADPRLPALEQAGDRFVAAHADLEPLVTDVDRYYNQKDYEDDGCAKGRALHGKLMPAFERFMTADAALRAILARDYPALQQRQLDRLEKSAPASVHYAFLKLSLAAQSVLDEAARVQGTDVTALRAAIGRYEEAVKLVTSRCTGLAPMHRLYSDCVFTASSRESFARTAKQMARDLARPPRRPGHPLLSHTEAPPIDGLRGEHRALLSHLPAGLEQRPSHYDSCYR